MSIKKKIILSFILSYSLRILLGVLAYADFVLIMDDIRYIETTDRIRGKTLELRRHEKNFLRGDLQSAEMVRTFYGQIKSIIRSGGFSAAADPSMKALEENLDGYQGIRANR